LAKSGPSVGGGVGVERDEDSLVGTEVSMGVRVGVWVGKATGVMAGAEDVPWHTKPGEV